MSGLNKKDEKKNSAADLVRSRIDSLYQNQVDQNTEEDTSLLSKFWDKHHSHPDPHMAWQDYYHSLTEDDKIKLWEEYHISANQYSGLPDADKLADERPRTSKASQDKQSTPNTKTKVHSKVMARKKSKRKNKSKSGFFRNHIWPIISAGLVVSFVWLVFNNELVIAKVKQYISPGDTNVSPVIIDPKIQVGQESKIVIPKINVDVPVVYDVPTRSEEDIQAALEDGVVHYAYTQFPGEIGNNVIVGHSSNNFFNGGKYKFAFVLLNRLEIDDTFVLHHEGTRYVYRIFNKQVVDPNDFSLIGKTQRPITTLITCDPPGTSWRRLIVQGEQISPDPDTAQKATVQEPTGTQAEIVPGNAPSLWSRFWNWIF